MLTSFFATNAKHQYGLEIDQLWVDIAKNQVITYICIWPHPFYWYKQNTKRHVDSGAENIDLAMTENANPLLATNAKLQ